MSTDTKNKLVSVLLSSAALGAPHAIAIFSEAGHKINLDQHVNSGGKILGRMQVADEGSGVFTAAIATGRAPESDWHVNGNAVTPAYTPAYPAPTVGVGTDGKPNLNNGDSDIASNLFPVVLRADLEDIGNPVNYNEYSGKKTGSVVLVDDGGVLRYAIAEGGSNNSTWTMANGNTLTPVGTPIPSTVVNGNEQKPVIPKVDVITCVDFPVVYAGDLASEDYTNMYNEEQTQFRHNNHQVVAYSGGKLRLMYAVYDTGTLTWYDLADVVASVAVAASSPDATITNANGTVGTPATASVDAYTPSGTVVTVDATGDSTGNKVVNFTTERGYSITELIDEVIARATDWGDMLLSRSGDVLVLTVSGTDTTITFNDFSFA